MCTIPLSTFFLVLSNMYIEVRQFPVLSLAGLNVSEKNPHLKADIMSLLPLHFSTENNLPFLRICALIIS